MILGLWFLGSRLVGAPKPLSSHPHLTFSPQECVMVSGPTACRATSASPAWSPSSCDDLLQTASDGMPSPHTLGAS